jgi:hypothetical protein
VPPCHIGFSILPGLYPPSAAFAHRGRTLEGLYGNEGEKTSGRGVPRDTVQQLTVCRYGWSLLHPLHPVRWMKPCDQQRHCCSVASLLSPSTHARLGLAKRRAAR